MRLKLYEALAVNNGKFGEADTSLGMEAKKTFFSHINKPKNLFSIRYSVHFLTTLLSALTLKVPKVSLTFV